MLWLLIQIGVMAIAILAALGFYFTRSSKNMPKNFAELRSEIQWQVIGVVCLIEDAIMRSMNHVELYSQPGRVAVITGGNRGIGLRVVEKLLKCDMTVVLGVRSPEEAKENVEKLIDVSTLKGNVYYEELDIGSMNSVRQFAAKLKSRFSKIDILINNAGIMAAPYSVTEDGFESQMAINYIGHFLLTHLIMPELKAAGTPTRNSRIVNVSSVIHLLGETNFDDFNFKKSYYPAWPYNNSKMGQVIFTKHLQRLFDENNDHVQIHAVHPGVVDTDLFCHSSTTYVPWFNKLLFKTPEEGSRTVVYAAISKQIEGKGGSYMSNCRRAKMNSLAKDRDVCEKYFQFTCDQLLNIKEYGNGK